MPFVKGNTIWKGRKHSQETKDKLSASHMGVKLSEEHKSKMHKFPKGFTPWNKGKKCPAVTGSNHPKWKGGTFISKVGYRMVLSRKHPFAHTNGYILEHRLIMEDVLGRYLLKSEVVHHINKDRLDNRKENLQLFSSNKEHLSKEHNGYFKNINNSNECRQCHICKNILTIKNNFHKSKSHTFGYSYVCKNCFKIRYSIPRKNKKLNNGDSAMPG